MAGLDKRAELAELHVHLGGSVDPAVMWELAHAQGIRMPTKNYWKFADMITVDPHKGKSFKEYLALFDWTERIQSGPLGVERSVYHTISGAYRKNNITLVELRFNPMKRNRGGEQDLDQIMMAAIRGLDRASLEYPVKAGIIVCLDRTFNYKLNSILVEKAMKYQSRGVVGIDIAGPARAGFRYSDYRPLYRRARKAGLGLTVHVGEDDGYIAVREVLESLEPDRIGHGIKATDDSKTMGMLRDSSVTLEICPTSNMHTHVVSGIGQLKRIFKSFRENKIRYTINTDGPEMLKTNLVGEIGLLIKNKVINEREARDANSQAFKASFLR